MTEKELKEKYLEMEQMYLDQKVLRGSEIVMNSKLREEIEALRAHNEILSKVLEKYLQKYAKIKVYFDNLLNNDNYNR
jgi:hypothetical protein